MPTKPVSAFTHATNVNYTVGPSAGNPTKIAVPDAANGFIPGQGIAAEHVNTPLNVTGLWLTDWVAQGSPDPDEDEHIVETSAVGRIGVIGADVGSVSKDATVVNADNSSSLPTVLGTNNGAGCGGEFRTQRTATEPILKLDWEGAGAITRGALAFSTPIAAPSAANHADVWGYVALADSSNLSALGMHDEGSGNDLRVWGTEEGYFGAHAEALGDTIDTLGVGFVEALSQTIDPQPGKYLIHFSCSGRNTTGGTHQILVEFDTGAAGKSVIYEVEIGSAGNKHPFNTSWLIDITGVTTLTIGVQTSTATLGVAVSDCEFTVIGALDINPLP